MSADWTCARLLQHCIPPSCLVVVAARRVVFFWVLLNPILHSQGHQWSTPLAATRCILDELLWYFTYNCFYSIEINSPLFSRPSILRDNVQTFPAFCDFLHADKNVLTREIKAFVKSAWQMAPIILKIYCKFLFFFKGKKNCSTSFPTEPALKPAYATVRKVADPLSLRASGREI